MLAEWRVVTFEAEPLNGAVVMTVGMEDGLKVAAAIDPDQAWQVVHELGRAAGQAETDQESA